MPDACERPDCAGEMAGDIGFDPLEITKLVNIQWSREVCAPASCSPQLLIYWTDPLLLGGAANAHHG